ncbi:uncharacterized protein LOC122798199 isoform X2 [Protopterus annectens]|uniref:uncharacterized protein LOC122798199 isoform X2 n=1 Tax=Protopterus annectens TaxID=7888 RepID=UPI001CFA42C8|nr:uncharacterized protein LOC122798199 isoform X2 [Protopterus annectens]
MEFTGSSIRSGRCAGSRSSRASWDNASNTSAISTGTGSEIDAGNEDKKMASRAVAFVIKSTRKGIVPLCADVAQLLKVKQRLEKTIRAQQFEIQHLKNNYQPYSEVSSACSQTGSPATSHSSGPLCSSEVPSLNKDIERMTLSSYHGGKCSGISADGMMTLPSIVGQGLQTTHTLITKAVQTSEEMSRQVAKTMVSKEVQVECLHFQMHKHHEEQLTQTLSLNSKLSEDLGNAWKQLEALHERLCQAEDHWQKWHRANTQQPLSRNSNSSHCGDFQPANCELASSCWECSQLCLQHAQYAHIPGKCFSGERSPYEQDQKEKQQQIVQNHKIQLDRIEVHAVGEGKARSNSPDFTVDSSYIRSVFSFPMVGCKCFSCAAFFSNHKHCLRREINKLVYLQRQKFQVNVNDYAILNENESGTVLYIGHLNNSEMPNVVFVGVELDEPSGSHDGVFGGKRYFQCNENHGIFAPLHEIFYVIHRKASVSECCVIFRYQDQCLLHPNSHIKCHQ